MQKAKAKAMEANKLITKGNKMSFQTPITIASIIEDIESNRYLLPAIQREFVWNNSKIEWLFDSLMRNYPVSSFLFWSVQSDIRAKFKFYSFLKEYREKYKIHNQFFDTTGVPEFTAVLDGPFGPRYNWT